MYLLYLYTYSDFNFFDYKSYHPNGQLWEEVNYIDGKKI